MAKEGLQEVKRHSLAPLVRWALKEKLRGNFINNYTCDTY